MLSSTDSLCADRQCQGFAKFEHNPQFSETRVQFSSDHLLACCDLIPGDPDLVSQNDFVPFSNFAQLLPVSS